MVLWHKRRHTRPSSHVPRSWASATATATGPGPRRPARAGPDSLATPAAAAVVRLQARHGGSLGSTPAQRRGQRGPGAREALRERVCVEGVRAGRAVRVGECVRVRVLGVREGGGRRG